MSLQEKMTTIADAIREKTGSSEKLGLDDMASGVGDVYSAGFAAGKGQVGDGYEEGFAAGQQAGYDRFWDIFQENGNRTAYNYAFYGSGWSDDNFRPKHDIRLTKTGGERIFSNSKITDVKKILEDCGVVLDTSGLTTASTMFQAANYLTSLPYLDLSNASSLNNAFQSCFNLHYLHIKVSENATFVNAFYSCPVSDLTIEGTIGNNISLVASNLLTDASIQSVIDALKDLTGQTAQTLTLHADVGARLTDAQKATITAKNWTLVYQGGCYEDTNCTATDPDCGGGSVSDGRRNLW